MKYKNTETRAMIDSPCIISGGDWIECEKEKVSDPYKAITKDEIINVLIERGIEHDINATKKVLYDLMVSQGE